MVGRRLANGGQSCDFAPADKTAAGHLLSLDEFTGWVKSAARRASPVSSRICMPVPAKSTV